MSVKAIGIIIAAALSAIVAIVIITSPEKTTVTKTMKCECVEVAQ